MKRTNRKGFTTVELVIVIAVIAILAAVLIPTFVSLVKKANQSADIQLAKNLNTTLAMDEAANGKPKDFVDVLNAMYENGFVLANMNPTSEGCFFVWESDANQIMLIEIDGDKYDVLFNLKDTGDADETWHVAVRNERLAATVKAALPNVTIELTILNTTDLNNEINNGGENTVYVDGNIVVDDNNTVKLDNANAVTTIDLGSNTVTGGSNDTSAKAFPFYVTAGTLNLKNGVIGATADWYDSDNELVHSAIKADDGVLNIDSTKFNCPNGSILIAYSGADGTVKNATINTKSSAINIGGGSNVVVENCTINVENEAVWVSNSGGYDSKATIKGGTYSGIGNTIATYGGTIVIEDGVFKSTQKNLLKFYDTGCSLTIKGGTFNGVKFEDLTASIIKGMFATSSTNYANIQANWTGSAWVVTN